jgi:hypothetical protein
MLFLFYYLMLNTFRMLIHPSSGACDLFAVLFHGFYCSGTMCVGVTVWFGWGGVVWYPDITPHDPSQAVLQPASACISPVTDLEWSRGFQEVKVPRFNGNGTPAAFTSRKYSWYSFLLENESTPGP